MKYYKKSKFKYCILFILHNVLPYLAFCCLIIYSFIQGEPREKRVIGISAISILILVGIAAYKHRHLSCITWIICTLIYTSIKDIFMVPLLCITIYTCFDDLIFKGLYTKYQKEYRDHKVLNEHEVDMRNE